MPASDDVIAAQEGSEFLIERRAGHPFRENRYFCSAPLPTRKHREALVKVEQILLAD
jgi:hypothetical protein